MHPATAHAASVVIPTRNRCDLLRTSIKAALAQSVSVEVIVLDDGSTDGTEAMVRQEFSQVIYRRYEGGRGPCFLRNRGIELAAAAIVFPIDDDAVMVSPRCVEQTLGEFAHPRVGAVGMPFINVRADQRVLQQAPDSADIYGIHAFVCAAHAVRRDVFLDLGGYREHFFYMGEEGDFCIRMLQYGFITRVGSADPIHHHESPSRNLERASVFGRQNDVLFVWHNVPMPVMIANLTMTSLRGFLFGFRLGHPWWMVKGLWRGYMACVRHFRERRPVSRSIFRLYRRLKKTAPMLLTEIEPLLPPLSDR